MSSRKRVEFQSSEAEQLPGPLPHRDWRLRWIPKIVYLKLPRDSPHHRLRFGVRFLRSWGQCECTYRPTASASAGRDAPTAGRRNSSPSASFTPRELLD